jgi:hypothetical protein
MIDQSKLPVPVRATSLRFLNNPRLPMIAILEVETDTNPVRIGFDKAQLEELARAAAIAAVKVLAD